MKECVPFVRCTHCNVWTLLVSCAWWCTLITSCLKWHICVWFCSLVQCREVVAVIVAAVIDKCSGGLITTSILLYLDQGGTTTAQCLNSWESALRCDASNGRWSLNYSVLYTRCHGFNRGVFRGLFSWLTGVVHSAMVAPTRSPHLSSTQAPPPCPDFWLSGSRKWPWS